MNKAEKLKQDIEKWEKATKIFNMGITIAKCFEKKEIKESFENYKLKTN